MSPIVDDGSYDGVYVQADHSEDEADETVVTSATGVANISNQDRMDVYLASLNLEGPVNVKSHDYTPENIRYYSDENDGNMPWLKIPTTLNRRGHNIFNIDSTIFIDIKSSDDMYHIVKNNKIQNATKHLSGAVYCAFTATNLNLIVGVITKSGTLSVCQQVMDLINNFKGIEAVSELIHKMNDYATKVIGAYVAKPDAGLPEDMKKDIMINLLFDIRSKQEEMGSALSTKGILNAINSSLNGIFGNDNSSMPLYYRILNSQKMFKHMLSSITSKTEEEQKKAFRLGIKVGSKLFSAFQRAGYIYNASSEVWEKDVDIQPKYAHFNQKLYKIPVDLIGKCYVKKLQFSPDVIISDSFSIAAVGKHPNISSSKVCIGGQLANRFRELVSSHMDFVEEYVKFLLEIEEALKRMNFDSSFTSADSFYGKSIKDNWTEVNNMTEFEDTGASANRGKLRRI
ncbi:MAG: hypothetical protein KAS32_09185 [Candidatus Peribacteraceae bacterium]|nr:hypothetical protein [Candidatus Peribacteraceae bacterium]